MDPKTTAARLRALADELDPPGSTSTPTTTRSRDDDPPVKGDRRAAYVRRAAFVIDRLIDMARGRHVEGLTADGLRAALDGVVVDGWSVARVGDLSALVGDLDTLAGRLDADDPVPVDLADLAYLVADLVDVVDRLSSGHGVDAERVFVLRDAAAGLLRSMGIDGPALRHVDPRRRHVVATPAGSVFLSYADGCAHVDAPGGRRLASFPLAFVDGDADDPDFQGALAALEGQDDDADDLDLVALAGDLYGVAQAVNPDPFHGPGEWPGLTGAGRGVTSWFAVAVAAAAAMTRRALDVPTPVGRLFVDGTADDLVVEWRPEREVPATSGLIVPDMDARADGQVVGPWYTEGGARRLVDLEAERARRAAPR